MQSILPGTCSNENQLESQISKFLKQYNIGNLLRRSNFGKDKGFSCFYLFKFVFMLVFTGKNLYRTLQADDTPGLPSKNSVYRFLNSTSYNWRKFLNALSSLIIKDSVSILTSAERIKGLPVPGTLVTKLFK